MGPLACYRPPHPSFSYSPSLYFFCLSPVSFPLSISYALSPPSSPLTPFLSVHFYGNFCHLNSLISSYHQMWWWKSSGIIQLILTKKSYVLFFSSVFFYFRQIMEPSHGNDSAFGRPMQRSFYLYKFFRGLVGSLLCQLKFDSFLNIRIGCSFVFPKNEMIDSLLIYHLVIAYLVTKN
jgi:hypothetical protein